MQEAEGQVPKEEPTVPGEPPGVYGCDYQTLARIAVLHAEARIALLNRDPKVGATQPSLHHSHSCLIMLPHCMHGSPRQDALGLRSGNGSPSLVPQSRLHTRCVDLYDSWLQGCRLYR